MSGQRWQLLETRDGIHRKDVTSKIQVVAGAIEVKQLAPGAYVLRDLLSEQATTIEVTAGTAVNRYLVGEARSLEQVERPTARISKLELGDGQVVLKLDQATQFTRVHVLLSRYVNSISPNKMVGPEYTPSLHAYRRVQSGYVSNLRLDDEYRYILERQLAKKYPGNMLPQPTLLLNPWDLGESVAREIEMAKGQAMSAAPMAAPAPASAEAMDPRGLAAAQVPGDPATVEYLKNGGRLLVNLVVDKEGQIKIDQETLGDAQLLTLIVVDPLTLQVRQVPLNPTDLARDDLRLARALPNDKRFAQTRAVLTILPDRGLEVGDVQSARAQIYATLGDLYQYYAAQLNDEKFARFAFLPQWLKLKDDEKLAKYNEFACHELHLFLYFKDREFFNKVVRPLLLQKKDPQFIDHWLLEEDLGRYVDLWRYGQLNAAERALFAVRVAEQRDAVGRQMKDWLQANPEDPQVERQRLMSALAGMALGLADDKSSLRDLRFGADEPFDRAVDDFGAMRGELGGMGGGGLGNTPGKPGTGAPADARKEKLERRAGRKLAEESKEFDAPGGPASVANGAVEFFAKDMQPDRYRKLFRQLDATRRWAESNYYRATIAQVSPEIIPIRDFWRDVALQEAELSRELLNPVGNYHEALFALAVVNLPLDGSKIESDAKEGKLVIRSTKPAVVVTEQIREVKPKPETAPTVLIGQRIAAENAPPVSGDAPAKVKEFVVGQVYHADVILSNPTDQMIDADILIQIPQGSLPLESARPTESKAVRLEPFSTEQLQVKFYFPAAGEFPHYGSVVSRDGTLLAAAESTTIKVLAEPSGPDEGSWPYLVEHGSVEQVVEYLKTKANLFHVDLTALAPRMNDRQMFDQVTKVLRQLRRFDGTLWGYAFKHQALNEVGEFLSHRDDVVNMVGPVLVSKVLTVDPIERELYEHIEFRPLEVPRMHPTGGRWQIPNAELQAQWDALTNVLAHQATPNDRQRLSLTYFLLLQHRIEEAVAELQRVDRQAVGMPIAYDYLTAYLDFYRGRYQEAAQIASQYVEHPTTLWRTRFSEVASQVREHLAMVEGESIELPQEPGDDSRLVSTAEARREREQTQAAALQPTFDFRVEGTKAIVKWQNLERLQVNYYLLDVELLFTRNPFVQNGSSRASLVEPNEATVLKLPSKQGETTFEIPAHLAKQNVLVELVAGNLRQSQVASGGLIGVQLASGYGQLQASVAGTTKPLIGAYVKVYARIAGGEVKFWKDGYTDLRGRLDYASVSGGNINEVERFSVLVLEPEHGALIKEVEPPR